MRAEVTAIGQIFTNDDGDTLVVKKTWNRFLTANFCPEIQVPMLADVTFTESPTFHSAFKIDIPADFTSQDLAARDRFADIRIRAEHISHQIFLVAKSWNAHPAGDLDDVAENVRRAVSEDSAVTQTPIETSQVGDVSVRRWRTHFHRKFLPDETYQMTLIKKDNELVQIAIWGLARAMNPLRDQLRQIPEKVRWSTSNDPVETTNGEN